MVDIANVFKHDCENFAWTVSYRSPDHESLDAISKLPDNPQTVNDVPLSRSTFAAILLK